MIILHAGSISGRLFLWGEAAVEKEKSSSERRERKPKQSKVLPYPFDAGFDSLCTVLKDTAGLKVKPKERQLVTIWLPTAGGAAIASSALIAEPPLSNENLTLMPWKITALPLTYNEAVELLCICAGKQTLAPGVIIGHDLAYWVQAMRFAGALVARQQYLPGLVEENKTFRAQWEPVFRGSDTERLAKLAKTMPAAARAISGEDAGLPPEIPASVVLNEFIRQTVDQLVRSGAFIPSLPVKIIKHTFASIHDHWLHALRSADGVMEGEASELTRFAEQVYEWQRPISVSAASSFRLCFRLEEPEEKESENESPKISRSAADGQWQVRYLLQAADDPSLLIPVEDAWKTGENKAAVLKSRGFNTHEYLFSALGQAAGICPRIETSLKAAEPWGYKLDIIGAHEFLAEKALALEQADFGVMLPAWWTRKGTKSRLSVRANVKSPKMQGGNGLSLNEIINFDWEVALGDENLSLKELEMLAKLKSPLVKIRGQWVEINPEDIKTALEFWKKKAKNTATVREIIRMSLGAADTTGNLEMGGVSATGWIADLLAQLEGRTAFAELSPSEKFHGILRPYQARGYSWLAFLRRWGMGACLADDMGLGKTVQTLAMIQQDWETLTRPVLLICPTSVVNNWQKEAARFTPDLPVMVHHGAGRKKDTTFKDTAGKHAIVISSYALLHRDIKLLQEVEWAGVILDETQNIKNPETKQAKAARSIAADYKIALTGTPVENNVGDLWSIMEFLNPGFLGNQTAFKRNFFVPIQTGRDPEAAQRLKRLTGPFILRRLKTDKTIISDLPDKMEMKVFCTLTKEQGSLYAAVLKDVEEALNDAEGIQRKGLVLATLSKLKQVCNHPAQFLGDNSAISGRSGKLARLTEMLEEILEIGDRALIFSQFAEMGELLKTHLQETFGREALFLHGGVTKPKRDKMVERFQGANGPSLFILSLKAGGTGLNLTQANHVFHFDRWWNPAVENQATDRAFRIGQTKNVQVHKFICAGTLEDKIDEMIERKKAVAESVVGAGEGWLTELSNQELKELFALRKEAIGE